MTRTAVIPIAGNSSRFSALTSRPKWALRLGDRTILDWAVSSLLEENLQVDRFIFVLKARDTYEFSKSLTTLPKANVETVMVEQTPNGQAASVVEAITRKGIEGEFLVWNGDTHLVNGWSRGHDFSGHGLVVTHLEGHHWSFALIEGGLVTLTAEKQRISEYASVGLYNFASPEAFLDAYEKSNNDQEVYVAPLYNFLIKEGQVVRPCVIRSESFLPLGTPIEVLASARRMGLSAPSELL